MRTHPAVAVRLLVVNVSAPASLTSISTREADQGPGKWWGASIVGHYFVAAPANAMQVLIMDLNTGQVYGLGVFGTDSNKFKTPAVVGHAFFASPASAKTLLEIDLENHSITL